MILDYNFSKNQNKLNISYITKTGGKNIMSFNVSRFKTYFKTPEGRFENWDGSRCDEKYTSDPSKFDIHTYIEELDPKYKDLLNQQYFPKLYCFDIETEISDEFPDPGEAKQPITVISISSPELNTIVLGTRPLSELENKYCNDSFHEYLENTSYFHELKLKMPEFRYIHFDTEEAMLDYFLKNIVAKVAILSGWNCIRFDWQYITNRIKNYYPNIAIRNCSVIKTVNKKRFQDMSGLHYELPMPLHTLIIDMMDTVDQLDQAVLPIKESLSLNWIAEASLGIKKIEYDGSLQDLFENDYKKYVYYNTIDSVLVQLINYRFRCLDIIYQYSMYCNEKIGDCFSKIALTEALVFKDFYKHGIKIVYEKKENIERGNLVGAYVKVPKPGLYEFACCNDFASLYPSTIITVNISFENYIGQFIDKYSLVPYLGNKEYVVVGPIVYKNDGTAEAPKAGKVLHIFLDDAALDKYRKDPNYFVSVNGCVYKNDKDYAFKRIQSKLKADRNVSKYFVKEIDATIVSDIGETLKNRCEYRKYSEGIVKELASLGYDIKNSNDLKAFSPEKLEHMKFELKMSMDFYESRQLAMKLLGNSMYGGSSHISFYWFNMNLANDITGEAKNLTLLMEAHFKHLWREKWAEMTDVHKMLNIEVDLDQCRKLLGYGLPEGTNPNLGDLTVYGDTDSIYSEYGTLLKTIKGTENMTIHEKLQLILDLNLKWLDEHNCDYIAKYYEGRHAKSVHKFELETVALRGAWLNVKKRYAQVLLWKDGKFYPMDDLPMKIKGLEIVQSSTPKAARKALLGMMRYILEEQDRSFFIHKINRKLMEYKREFLASPVEEICGNLNVHNYNKYIIDDTEMWPKVALKCPANVRALAQYNCFRNNCSDDVNGIYGGKLKWYFFKNPGMKDYARVAFQAGNFPKWLEKAAPVQREKQFLDMVITPLNRVLTTMGMPELKSDGSIQMTLF